MPGGRTQPYGPARQRLSVTRTPAVSHTDSGCHTHTGGVALLAAGNAALTQPAPQCGHGARERGPRSTARGGAVSAARGAAAAASRGRGGSARPLGAGSAPSVTADVAGSKKRRAHHGCGRVDARGRCGAARCGAVRCRSFAGSGRRAGRVTLAPRCGVRSSGPPRSGARQWPRLSRRGGASRGGIRRLSVVAELPRGRPDRPGLPRGLRDAPIPSGSGRPRPPTGPQQRVRLAVPARGSGPMTLRGEEPCAALPSRRSSERTRRAVLPARSRRCPQLRLRCALLKGGDRSRGCGGLPGMAGRPERRGGHSVRRCAGWAPHCSADFCLSYTRVFKTCRVNGGLRPQYRHK